MTDRRLVIGRRLLQRILEHCLEEKPYEACGILAGQEGRVSDAYATDNVMRSPIYFEVEPRQQEAVFRHMAQGRRAIVGIYHSHPTAPAVPSGNDIDQAVYYPDAIRLIISLQGPTDVGAFLIRDRTVQAVPLVIREDADGQYHDLRHLCSGA